MMGQGMALSGRGQTDSFAGMDTSIENSFDTELAQELGLLAGFPGSTKSAIQGIVPLSPAHAEYTLVSSKFYNSVGHVAGARVEHIYSVNYSEQVSFFGEREEKLGNVQSFFHGTTQSPDCTFGIAHGELCSGERDACNVCNICRVSFKLGYERNGARSGSRRGLFFSPRPEVSHAIATTSRKVIDGRSYQRMFLCKVACGNQAVPPVVGSNPQSVPAGYDSAAGGNLVVVADPSLAVPTHLIVYSV